MSPCTFVLLSTLATTASADTSCDQMLAELDQTARAMAQHRLYAGLQRDAAWQDFRGYADVLAVQCLPISSSSFDVPCEQAFYGFAAASGRLQGEAVFRSIASEVQPALGRLVERWSAQGCLFEAPQEPLARPFAIVGLTAKLLEMAPMWREALLAAPSSAWDALRASSEFEGLRVHLAALEEACQHGDSPQCQTEQTATRAAADVMAQGAAWQNLPHLSATAQKFLGPYFYIRQDYGAPLGIPEVTQDYIVLSLYMEMMQAGV